MGLETQKGSTPLISAIQRRDRAGFEALLAAGVDVNEQNDDGFTALMMAAEMGEVNCLNMLIHAGANLEAKDNQGRTALYIAESKPSGCSIALRAAGAGLDTKDKHGRERVLPQLREKLRSNVRKGNLESSDKSESPPSNKGGEPAPPQPLTARSGKRVPRSVRDELTKLVSLGGGHWERLEKLIELCKAYDDGGSTLTEAHRVCNPRFWQFAKVLDEAVKAWQPPQARPGFWKQLIGNARHSLSPQRVQFVREEKPQSELGIEAVKRIYSAPSRAIALEFLQRTRITKRLLYVEIDTPEGRVGKDIDATYDASGDIKDSNPATPPGFFQAVFTRRYLEAHVETTFTEILGHVRAIKETPDLIPNGYTMFHADVGEILEYLEREAKTGKFEGFAIHRSSTPVCLLVSAFPWETADVAANLASKFPGGGLPYKQLLDFLVRQKPSAHLTHWIHIMIGMIDGVIHGTAGSYASHGAQWQAYSWPAEILSERERRDLKPLHQSYHFSRSRS